VAADGIENYDIYGAAAAEVLVNSCYVFKVLHLAQVELDVLTGEKTVRRTDLMADVGNSVSPMVDLGQVEGSFIMGLGLWLTEEITYNPDNGRLLNFDSWVSFLLLNIIPVTHFLIPSIRLTSHLQVKMLRKISGLTFTEVMMPLQTRTSGDQR